MEIYKNQQGDCKKYMKTIYNSILLRAFIDSIAVCPAVIPSQDENIPEAETVDWATAKAMNPTIKSL